MLSFQLLRPLLADHMEVWIQMPGVGTPAIGVKTTNPKGREQRLEFQQCPICTAAKSIGYNPARLMIQRLPQPPWLCLAADKGPHLVQLRFLPLVDHHCRG